MPITIKEIAERAKVSIATVSRTINNSEKVAKGTSQKILSILKETGYIHNYLARSLVCGKMRTLELIIPDDEEFLGAYYFQKLFSGINEGINKNGYSILISQQDGKDKFLRGRFPVDGYIVISPTINSSVLKQLEYKKPPVVLINQRSNKFNWVDINNVSSSRKIINHLVKLGHRHIAIITGREDTQNSIDRIKGYKKALKENGIEFKSDYVFNGKFMEERSFEKTNELFLKGLPVSAIFACNDLMAIGVIRAIKSKNLKVPEDIAVVGFDDIDIASYFSPSITTIKQPLHKMGLTAVNLLTSQVESEKRGSVGKEFSGKLIIRKSCGAQ